METSADLSTETTERPQPRNRRLDSGPSVMRKYLESSQRFAWPLDERRDGEMSYRFKDEADLLVWERSLIVNKKIQNKFIDQYSIVDEMKEKMCFSEAFAVKLIVKDSSEEKEETNTEVKAMTDLRHPHVAILLGTFSTRNRLGILIYPAGCCDLGDLMTCISKDMRSENWNPKEPEKWDDGRNVVIHREYSWPFSEALKEKLYLVESYFLYLCRAVHYLHERRIRHKDIKPANIIIDYSGNVILMDFGISTKFEPTASPVTVNPLTPSTSRYMPPERKHGRPRDYRSDVWSLGCVFLEMSSLLLGKDIESCQSHCSHIVNRDGKNDEFCSNIASIETWIEILESADGGLVMNTDEVKSALPAIKSMLKQERDERPFAAELWKTFDFPSLPQCPDCHPKNCGRWKPTEDQSRRVESGDELRQRMTEAQESRSQLDRRRPTTIEEESNRLPSLNRSMDASPSNALAPTRSRSPIHEPSSPFRSLRRSSYGHSIRSASPPLQRTSSPNLEQNQADLPGLLMSNGRTSVVRLNQENRLEPAREVRFRNLPADPPLGSAVDMGYEVVESLDVQAIAAASADRTTPPGAQPSMRVGNDGLSIPEAARGPASQNLSDNYLHELMHGHYARRLEETSRKTFMEMVLVRSEIDDLRRLIVHSALVQQHKQNDLTPRADHANVEHQRLLRSLVETKTRNINNEKSDDKKPPAYYEVVEATKLAYSTIDPVTKPRNLNVSKQRVRTSGQYRPGNDSATEVWIEWKSYNKELDPRTKSEIASPENVKRVKELVTLLQSSSLSSFRVPHCLGYYDFRDDEKDSSHQALFGIVFQKPDQDAGSPDPISLRKLIDDHDTPSLSERIALGHTIADSVLYLNAVGWFHKGIRSDGIVFCPKSTTLVVDLLEPFMTGFEYARPDKSDAHSTHIPPDPENEAYVHPDYQGTDAQGTYRRSFDIYSLGIVLIEIAYWSPIHKVLANEFKDPTSPISAEVKEVRSRLLSEETTYLSKLRGMVGDRYHEAVYSCIEGLANDLDEKQIEVSLLLQKNFTEKVVENLGAVNV